MASRYEMVRLMQQQRIQFSDQLSRLRSREAVPDRNPEHPNPTAHTETQTCLNKHCARRRCARKSRPGSSINATRIWLGRRKEQSETEVADATTQPLGHAVRDQKADVVQDQKSVAVSEHQKVDTLSERQKADTLSEIGSRQRLRCKGSGGISKDGRSRQRMGHGDSEDRCVIQCAASRQH